MTALLLLLAKVSVLLALAAAVERLLARRASAAFRHSLWTLTIGGLLALPLLATVLPSRGLSLAIVPVPAPVREPAVMQAPDDPQPAQPLTAVAAPLDVEAISPRETGTTSWTPSTAAMALYLMVLLVLAVKLVAGHVAAHRMVRRASPFADADWRRLFAECRARLGVQRPVRLLRSDEPVMPMTVGVLRPAILLPACAGDWAPDRRRAVVLHELAHVARRDCLTQALAGLAAVVYWFHPGVWWAAARLRVEREYACDDRVLHAGAPAREYASHLLDIAYTLGSGRTPVPAVAMARPRELEGRLLAVMDAGRIRKAPGGTGLAGAALVTLTIVLALAAVSTATHAAIVPAGETFVETGLETITEPTPEAVADATATPAAPLQAPADATSTTGTWEIRPSKQAGEVHLELRQPNSSSGRSVPVSALSGLPAGALSTGGAATFTLTRDAGTFRFTGTFASGTGAGTYTFTPSPTFAAELAKRNIARPSVDEQHELAKHDVGLALVDELLSQGYPTPGVKDLVRMGHHGVTLTYVREMARLGYRVGTVEKLVTMRDHGVTPAYVEGLLAVGLPKLDADQLVRARDHGVTPEYARAMKEHGYASAGIDALVNARDHGVTADYVAAMASAGYAKLPLEALVNARDHGVTADYVKAMAGLGFTGLPIESLVKARDHGVTSDYAGGLRQLGYRADIEQLIRARDHGVTVDFVGGLKSLGYENLPLDELIQLRDHGVTPEKAKRANERAGTRLPPDQLRALASHGRL